MKIAKRILSSLVMFIFGLEVGGFGVWYLSMKILNESNTRSASRQHISYANYHKDES